MLFSSMVFLWIFLPAVLLGNFILTLVPFSDQEKRIHAKNILLLIASLIFYAWGSIYYLLIMLSSIFINYMGGQLLAHRFADDERNRKKSLIIVIILNLGILFVFKYFNMAVIVLENLIEPGVGSIINMQGTGVLGLKEIVLPIGISFFTFQAMSYVIDVYRGTAPVQDNPLDFALYVSFFPQLIAGPIVRYHDVALQINHRKELIRRKEEGVKRFCYGLGKKVLLANTFAAAADGIWGSTLPVQGLTALLGAACYTLQIYYDFSGYSDMAIGLGKLFGFEFKENFDYPYLSGSIREFWRRWHISLSTWFREYVYIPLGGNRKGKARTYVNLFIVFLLTGIWHGANFTFIAWGLYHGIMIVIERVFLGKLLEKNPLKFINHIYTMFIVVTGWVLFRSDTIAQGKQFLRNMFVFGASDQIVLSYLSMKLILCLIIGIALCGPVQLKYRSWYEKRKKQVKFRRLDFAAQILLLVLSVLALVSGTYNPFIYFQF